MVLRKITIDNSVIYVPISEKTKEKEIKPKTIKAGSLSLNKTKILHKAVKNLLKITQQEDLEYLND